MTQNVNTRIAALENARLEREAEARRQQEAEKARQRQIAQEADELVRLHGERRALRLDEAKHVNARHIEASRRAVAELYTAMDAISADLRGKLDSVLDATRHAYMVQQQYAQQAAYDNAPTADQIRAALANDPQFQALSDRDKEARIGLEFQAARTVDHHFPPAAEPLHALIAWVSRARTPDERRLAISLYWFLSGEAVPVQPSHDNIDPFEATAATLRNRRAVRW